MARPKKNNADYFSHDNDMRNDEKLKAVRRKFKHEGYSIWNMMLEKLSKAEGFTMPFNEMNIELWAGDFEIETTKLTEILEYFLKLGLLTHLDGEIFSENMIKRFSGLMERRNRKREQFSTGKTELKEVSACQNPQSKVNESKVNKSKVNQSTIQAEKNMCDLKISDCKLPEKSITFQIIQASITIYEILKAEFPKNRDIPTYTVAEFVKPVRELMQKKNYSYAEIKKVLDFTLKDPFWRDKAMSTEVFSRNFEKIKEKMSTQDSSTSAIMKGNIKDKMQPKGELY
jgi:hypothetical protein